MTQDDDLRDVIGPRMQLAQEVLDLAEDHREEVWERVSSRIKSLSPETDPAVIAPPEPPAPRADGPERRRPVTPPRYATLAEPQADTRWDTGAFIVAASAALVASAVATAAIIALN